MAMMGMHQAILRKRRGEGPDDVDDLTLEAQLQKKVFLSSFNETVSSNTNMEARALLLENIHCRLKAESYAETAHERSEFVAEKRRMDGLMVLNARRVTRNQNYATLLRVVVFFFFFSCMVLVQRQADVIFSTVDPLLRTLQGDLDAESGSISGPDDVYAVLESFAETVLEDSKCGDGICDNNEYEYPGFGRFGCEDDCGKYAKTSLISVQLDDFLGGSSKFGWDLSKISRSASPNFKWNLYSDTMGDFIFEEHQAVSGYKEMVEVPDGKLELRLFQTTKLHNAVDAVAVFNAMMLVPTSLPERNEDIPDFAYGDAREAMAATTIIVQDVKEHCWIGDPAKFDIKCMEFPPVDTLYKAMGGYGLSGSVTMAGKGKAPISLASVSYCGFLPAGLQGVANTTNKEHLKTNSLRCSAVDRRRWSSSFIDAVSGRGVGTANNDLEGVLGVESQPTLALNQIAEGEHGSQSGLQPRRTTGRHLLQLAGKGGACIWHDGCDPLVKDDLTGKTGQFCAKGGYCEVCSFCQVDSSDAVDGVCPMSMCPGSGRLPECVSGSKLTDNLWKCKDTYAFEVWKYHKASDGAPMIKPAASVPHRFITPGNEVIGGVGMVLRRGKPAKCPDMANKHLLAFSNGAGLCTSEEWDSTPYGFDPIFLASSDLYNGNLRIRDFYQSSERLNSTTASQSAATSESKGGNGVPFAFFPHSYDAVGKRPKNASLIVEDFKDSYIAYLDTRLSSSSGADIVSLLKEGGFIDKQVKEIDVHVPVLNVQSMILGLATLEFRWDEGGSIEWDYQIQMMKTAPYSVPGNSMGLSFNMIMLQALVILMGAFEIGMSIRDAWHSFRKLALVQHVSKPGVWLDWTSHVLQTYFWILWATFHAKLSNFKLKSASTYSPLAEPNGDARWLASDPQGEFEWLQLVLDLQSLLTEEAYLYCILGFAVLVFLFRFLAACHFQPKWASVTGTLLDMIPDTINYLILYLLIIGGYAVVGMQLFGHQFGDFSNWGDAMQAILNFLLTMDPGFLWDQCEHAAADNTTFQIYIWSLVVLGFLIMFNIFCCIVVDAYMGSKESMEATSNTTVGQDLRSTTQMLYNMLTKSNDVFWSDGYLESIIRIHTKAEGVPLMSQLRSFVVQAFNSNTSKSMTLKGEHGGITFSVKDLKRLTSKPTHGKGSFGLPMFGGQQTGPMAYLKDEDDDESDSDSDSDTDSEAGSLVDDLIERYNEEEDFDVSEQNMLETIKLEGMMRKVCLTQQMSWMTPKIKRAALLMSRLAHAKGLSDMPSSAGPKIEALTSTTADLGASKSNAEGRKVIKVNKMHARGLPITKPIFGKAHAYVMIFLKDEDDDIDQAQVKKSKNAAAAWEMEWKDESFVIPLPEDEEMLCLLIYSHDGIGKDQLLGSFQVNGAELPNHVEGQAPQSRVYRVINRQLPARSKMADARFSVAAEIWTQDQIEHEEEETDLHNGAD